jgi:hypothetical protein
MFHCQVEYGQSERTDTFPCGKPAVAECSDCGISICSDCREECCGDWFCGQCYDYHATHSCVKKPVQNECGPLSTATRGQSKRVL